MSHVLKDLAAPSKYTAKYTNARQKVMNFIYLGPSRDGCGELWLH